MRVLLASSEVHPYSKTGGLADMAGALGKYLARAGVKTGIVTPLYRGTRAKFPALKASDITFELPLGDRRVAASIWTLDPLPNLTVYFVDQPAFFDRAEIYQEKGISYPDNADRYIYFSKCVVRCARQLSWQPQVLHIHDWQTGLVPLLVRHAKDFDGWTHAPRTCFTIHNLAYQGQFSMDTYRLTNLPWYYFTPEGVEFYGGFNCLKTGLVFTDLITTVSPRYAREITTEAFGCGLDGLLRARQNALFGILNGVDYSEWNTEHNPHLRHAFSVENLEGKRAGKLALQQEYGLPQRADVPLFGTISRLADQKGMDLELAALEEMIGNEIQFVLLGTGDPMFESAFAGLAQRYPNKVAVKIGYDAGLAHRIEAGCDFFLMPSRFEPCGLNQMYSLRYGTIPIVRATGGLDDSVIDVTENADWANGIKFYDYSAAALVKAMHKALVIYADAELLKHYRLNAMEADFSWERTAQEYQSVYQRLLVGAGSGAQP
ncbi:MAG: glycogen synthase GlgA [Verrucomicrobiota bacterium]